MMHTRNFPYCIFVLAAVGCYFPKVDLGDIDGGAGNAGTTGGSGSESTGGSSSVEVIATGGSFAVETTPTGGSSSSDPLDIRRLQNGTPLTGVAQVAVGWGHVCALFNDGKVDCWGGNYGGMLGDGTMVSHIAPEPVQELSGSAVAIDADYTDSCAKFSDGRFQCWGSNNYGQLGDGTTIERHLPTGTVTGFTQVSLGEYHTCGLTSSGTVSCWGDNTIQQYSTSVGDMSLLPVPISGLSNVTQVSAGANIDCALQSDMSVWCWGHGVGAICAVNSGSFALAPIVSGAVQISSGGAHACAVTTTGTVTCWGANHDGQVGSGASDSVDCVNYSWPPGTVPDLGEVTQVAAGYSHTCALLKTGQVACWGYNVQGQLGDGTIVSHATPSLAIGVKNAISISAGYGQTCAVIADGSLMCWGNFSSYLEIPPQAIPYIVTR